MQKFLTLRSISTGKALLQEYVANSQKLPLTPHLLMYPRVICEDLFIRFLFIIIIILLLLHIIINYTITNILWSATVKYFSSLSLYISFSKFFRVESLEYLPSREDS